MLSAATSRAMQQVRCPSVLGASGAGIVRKNAKNKHGRWATSVFVHHPSHRKRRFFSELRPQNTTTKPCAM